MMRLVKNLKDIPLNLESGAIAPGDYGLATIAETQVLFKYLEVLDHGEEKESTETRPDADDAQPRQETVLKKRGRPAK